MKGLSRELRSECEFCLPYELQLSFRGSKRQFGAQTPADNSRGQAGDRGVGLRNIPPRFQMPVRTAGRGERGRAAQHAEGTCPGGAQTCGTHKRLKPQRFTPSRKSPPVPASPAVILAWRNGNWKPFSELPAAALLGCAVRVDEGISYRHPPPCGSAPVP